MAANEDLALMAHLMRRAGFGATRDELEELVPVGYETVVERLLHPEDARTMPDDVIRRYHVEQSELRLLSAAAANWMYRMITTDSPLEEKLALFWHGLFATGYAESATAKDFLGKDMAVITKPFAIEAFASKVREMLGAQAG